MEQLSAADPEEPVHRRQGKRRFTQPHQGFEAFEIGALKSVSVTNQQLLHEIETRGFCAWPIRGVVPPGETISVQFGCWCTGCSGVHHSEWELHVYPGSSAISSLPLAEPASTNTITVVAVMLIFQPSAEILWQQESRTRRRQASRAAEETIQQLMQLRHQRYQLELLQEAFQPLRVDLQRGEEPATRDRASVSLPNAGAAPSDSNFNYLRDELCLSTAGDEGGVSSLTVALAAAAEDTSSFSVQALHRHLLVLPPQVQRREYLRTMQHLLYQCDEWQPRIFQQSQARRLAHGQLQIQNVTTDSILHSALSDAIEAFLSALPEAPDLLGLSPSEELRGIESGSLNVSSSFYLLFNVCVADEKGRQVTRGSKRQFAKGKRESKMCEEPGGSPLAGAASAALTAVMASACGADNILRGEGDTQTRHCVAEQLLYWLMKEAIAAKETDLAMTAATQTAAAGSAIAEAARDRQCQQDESPVPQLLREAWLPSPVDLRVDYLTEYMSRKQLQHVTACGMALILFDEKVTEDVLSLLQQPSQPKEQQVCIQRRLQQRLGFLVHLLPKAQQGVMLCLGLSSEQSRRLPLQGPALLCQLLREMLGSGPQHEQMLPVACLRTAAEIASFIEDRALRKEVALFQRDASTAAMASKSSADFEASSGLLIVPSWQYFFAQATETLTTLLQGFPLTNSCPAVGKIRYDTKALDLDEKANYLTTRRHMLELATLLEIDLLLLDSFKSVTQVALRGAPPLAEGDLANGLAAAAAAEAVVHASNPWLSGLPATHVLGPHVSSYLLATCLLMGIDVVALQERSSQLRSDWKEETRRKESLDAAADAVRRRMRKEFRRLTTDCRSCCVYRVAAQSPMTAGAVAPDEDTTLPRSSNHLRPGVTQQVHDTKLAVLCSYWDMAFREVCADEAAATVEPLLQWAALQFQHLKALVSGTVISHVLLAGDLINLICGFALNGHVVIEPFSQQDDDLEHREVLNNIGSVTKANAWAGAAALRATEGVASGPSEGISRAWLRIPLGFSEDVCSNSKGLMTMCSIQPRVTGVRQLREFLQHQLLAVLRLELANESLAPAELSRVRQNSDGCASSQRSGSKIGKSLTKPAAAEGFVDGIGTSDAVEKKEKQQPKLVICHLPQARLLWNVLRDIQTSARVPVTSQVETPIHPRRSKDGEAAPIPYGTYASLPTTAIDDVLASVGTPKLLLWLGEEMSRPTHTAQQLVKAAGFLDATSAMTQSLFSSMKYAL
ncbi:hypothetical protein ACSSS7_006027 [Eimeria intestinalis]